MAHYGLVVTTVPKVPIWKVCDFNALRFRLYSIALILLDNQLFVSIMLIHRRAILEQEFGSSLIKGLQVPQRCSGKAKALHADC
jgi:hypothetical protein